MRKRIQISEGGADINQDPDYCPVCHFHVDPGYVGGAHTADREIQCIYRCTRQECRNYFLASYRQHHGDNYFSLQRLAPKSARKHEFPQCIESLSPTFVEIYNQALAADTHELAQLVGIGLRKALEFLVKDYAIHEHPDKTEEIKKTPLSGCIKTYISDANVQKMATLATWLGNDETHYIRRWEDKDITDLERLVKLTTNWIENVLLTEQYTQEMGQGGAAEKQGQPEKA